MLHKLSIIALTLGLAGCDDYSTRRAKHKAERIKQELKTLKVPFGCTMSHLGEVMDSQLFSMRCEHSPLGIIITPKQDPLQHKQGVLVLTEEN